MNNIKAIFIKQFVNQIKVPSIIVFGVMFLIIAAAFLFLFGVDDDCDYCIPAYVCVTCEEDATDLPEPSVAGLFTIIFVGMALISSASATVLEDKTTKNLQFMAMADVKPYQYLLGTHPSLMIVVSTMLILFALLDGQFGADFLLFMALGIAGGAVSILFGMVIGLSKVPVLAMPVSMVLGLGPTLSIHNEQLASILRFTFVQQVNIGISDLSGDLTSNFMIIGINGIVVLLVFVIMHRKNKFNL
jgi:ABC-2 type transport system permease protein